MNTNNYYKIYIDDTIKLAASITIKSTDAASLVNNELTLNGFRPDAVNEADPTTWKYYLNLAGEYSSIDEEMTVVSLDTLERIKFNKENLAIHQATKTGYAFGTRLYYDLLNTYPNQELLIRGILYPVDINRAIAAYDGEILTYPPELVEPNEYSLIAKLQKWILGYKGRWTNPAFGLNDNLYHATVLGIMYVNLVPAILNFRLEACKTNEAHSFHVSRYLASHGFLDFYINNLTLEQKLFFYRNIAYIEHNSGKNDTLQWLVEHIMTERSLPIAEYVMKHQVDTIPTDLYPTVVFNRRSINPIVSANSINQVDIPTLLTKQFPEARDNSTYFEDSVVTTRELMENSLSNTVLTKSLESVVIDYTDSSPYKLTEALLSHWVYLSNLGLYKAIINVNNPKTSETLSLGAADAYTLAWYVFGKTIGLTLTQVPQIFAKRVQNIKLVEPTSPILVNGVNIAMPLPASVNVSLEEVMSVVDPTVISERTAMFALSVQPVIDDIISTRDFNKVVNEINDAAQIQRGLIASQETLLGRSMLHNLVSKIYSDNVIDLAPETMTYSQFLGDRNIDINDLSISDNELLYLSLVREATGLDPNTPSALIELQQAMVGMLRQLSSYSIQVTTEINNSKITRTNWTATRVGDTDYNTYNVLRLHPMVGELLNVDMSTKSSVKYDVGVPSFGNHQLSNRAAYHFEVPAIFNDNYFDTITRYRLRIANVRVTSNPKLTTNSEGIIPVVGLDTYLGLTQIERNSILDIYNGQQIASLPVFEDPPLAHPLSENYFLQRYVNLGYNFDV